MLLPAARLAAGMRLHFTRAAPELHGVYVVLAVRKTQQGQIAVLLDVGANGWLVGYDAEECVEVEEAPAPQTRQRGRGDCEQA